jgi:hypothetical protein
MESHKKDVIESGSWSSVSVPWAIGEIEATSEVTPGVQPLSGDVSTFGGTVMATLADLQAVSPRTPGSA